MISRAKAKQRAAKAVATRRRNSKRARSTKGKLLKGMTHKLPAAIFVNPYFEAALQKVLKGYAGIYILYRGDEIYYVGLTKDLFSRMRTHLRDRHRRKWDSFKIFRIKKVNYLKDVETLLLNVHATNGNSVTGHLPAKFNLTKPFKSALEQQKKEISRIEKSLRG